jgi:hypothetical protein
LEKIKRDIVLNRLRNVEEREKNKLEVLIEEI